MLGAFKVCRTSPIRNDLVPEKRVKREAKKEERKRGKERGGTACA